jgi:hypothetical protein
MSESFKTQPLPRRSIVRGFLLTAFGAGLLRMTLSGQAAAESKASQKAVEYHDPATGSARCDNCKYFKPPASCHVVDGTIAPTGWCNKYSAIAE